MRKSITPYIAKAILNPKRQARKIARIERKRNRCQQPHRVTIYLRINDAHSYLLLQVLESLQERYKIEYDFRTVLTSQADMYPAPTRWQENAFDDCAYLADVYELGFPKQAPANDLLKEQQITAQLLHWELQPGYLQNALKVFHSYWQADEKQLQLLLNPNIIDSVECYQHHLKNNEALLKSEGHYLSAMLHYGDEWYWGLNRLQYLEQRFNALGMSEKVVFDQTTRNFCKRMSKKQVQAAHETKTALPSVEMFMSTRSPYSYIGLVKVRRLTAHYGISLVVKPVLPMLMRRMAVPKRKGHYILRDAYREAALNNIPFGFIADPLGKGVENTYALFNYASSQGKEIELLESVAHGVWSEGIRADTDKGLSKLVSRAGLDWNAAKEHLSDESWRAWAQENLAELYSLEQWGVPCFKFQNTVAFGQDRLDRIELAIVNALS